MMHKILYMYISYVTACISYKQYSCIVCIMKLSVLNWKCCISGNSTHITFVSSNHNVTFHSPFFPYNTYLYTILRNIYWTDPNCFCITSIVDHRQWYHIPPKALHDPLLLLNKENCSIPHCDIAT